MASSSTPNDIMRFVRLRPPGGAAREEFRLSDTNLSGELSTLKRAARRGRADAWLRQSGPYFVRDMRNDPTLQRVREVLRTLTADTEARSLRDLFLALEARDVCIGGDAEARRGPQEQLSDVILASYFAPGAAPEDLDELRQVFIVLELLRMAAERGVSRRDLHGPGRHDDLLDRELGPVIGSPLALPAFLASDHADKFAVGVGDLLVVKQHIRAYEATEIAHIENVMPGERRERSHRRLDRSEETFVTELETEVERETELATTERFELSEEASRTIKEEQQLSFGLSVSAKYGPTVEVGSKFDYERRDSREETAQSSTSYAKDVVERSLERVRERVLRKRTTQVLQELEETNLHGFEPGPERQVGIYQFVEKIYEARVFDYGKREMFDFMVPEPASYLWYLRKGEQAEGDSPTEPVPPLELSESVIPELTAIDEHGLRTYERLAARYRVEGIEAPPEERMTLSKSARYPEDGSVDGRDPSTLVLDLNIPTGYRPEIARLSAIAHSGPSDQHQVTLVGFVVLDRMSVRDIDDGRTLPNFVDRYGTDYLNPSTISGIGRTDEIMIFGMSETQAIRFDGHPFPDGSPLQIGVFGFATKDYVVSVEVECVRTETHLQNWRLKVFEKLSKAYEARWLEYQEQYARFQQERRRKEEEGNLEREFGAAPSRKEEIIHAELKKHCVAMLTEDFFTANDSPAVMEEPPSGPPRFRFAEARERGALVRFLEQAFEWQHIQYVFYPYFWGRTEPWAERFREDDPAHRFRQFMQAGWARVVVPVRPGFEEVLHYYLQTGNVWGGRGTPPRIGDPLSLSIADEIRERSSEHGLEAIPTGPPWEVRVPTNLVLLRADGSLPRWENRDEDGWDWHPVEGA